ncbi:hypothetical protein CHU98_g10280 [Xylaria longipes]|nr:hypothetical protein CHU98_g10280 [Xylaria longipes]
MTERRSSFRSTRICDSSEPSEENGGEKATAPHGTPRGLEFHDGCRTRVIPHGRLVVFTSSDLEASPSLDPIVEAEPNIVPCSRCLFEYDVKGLLAKPCKTVGEDGDACSNCMKRKVKCERSAPYSIEVLANGTKLLRRDPCKIVGLANDGSYTPPGSKSSIDLKRQTILRFWIKLPKCKWPTEEENSWGELKHNLPVAMLIYERGQKVLCLSRFRNPPFEDSTAILNQSGPTSC